MIKSEVWTDYHKAGITPMRPYVPGEDLSSISIASELVPCQGGMIARDPLHPADQWYIAHDYFACNYKVAP